MPLLRTQFGGLNSDQFPNRLPEGAADKMLNVTLDKGDLKKRSGFAEYEDDVTGSADGVLNIFVARFANADVYVVCKCDDGKLWQRRVYASAASSFTEIATEVTHNANDRGWFFMWADRLHYFDRAGGSRWHPDHLTGDSKAYKAKQVSKVRPE